MDWADYAVARQYLLEHRIGTRVREAKHREEALARKTVENLKRQERHGTG